MLVLKESAICLRIFFGNHKKSVKSIFGKAANYENYYSNKNEKNQFIQVLAQLNRDILFTCNHTLYFPYFVSFASLFLSLFCITFFLFVFLSFSLYGTSLLFVFLSFSLYFFLSLCTVLLFSLYFFLSVLYFFLSFLFIYFLLLFFLSALFNFDSQIAIQSEIAPIQK